MSDQGKLWEKSIVLAMRDLQWLACRKYGQFPEGCLSMAGRAETALGDATISAGSRFYLLEFKGDERDLRVEVKKGAYSALLKGLKEWESGNEESFYNLVQSVRCHYFVYWAGPDSRKFVGKYDGKLVCSSYFLDTLACSDEKDSDAALQFMSQISIGRLYNDRKWIELAALDARRFFGRSIKIKHRNSSCAAGLSKEEFQIYLDWLLRIIGDEGLPLNLIALSTEGDIFRFVANTTDMAQLLEELQSAKPSAAPPASTIEKLTNRSSAALEELNRRRNSNDFPTGLNAGRRGNIP